MTERRSQLSLLELSGGAPRPVRRPSRWPGGAVFAPHDGADAPFRFWLWRDKPDGDRRNRVAFVGLNPSKADVEFDDATIRKEIGFAERWGFDGLDMVNLWPVRSTEPDVLLDVGVTLSANYDPSFGDVFHDHDRMVREVFRRARRVVCAWGSHAMVARCPERVREVVRLVPDGLEVLALRLTKDGHPWHPLYVPYDVEPVPFTLGASS